MTNSNQSKYFSGGLAELVPSPTPITYSFFKKWFTGKASLGLAMERLGLPYEKTDKPVLEMHNNQLMVNLENEEDTLYSGTLFSYRPQKDISQTPRLGLKLLRLLNPLSIARTLRILFIQSKWIANQEKIILSANTMVDEIQLTQASSSREISDTLAKEVWPVVIAVGALAEFYHQVLLKESDSDSLIEQVSERISKEDWFFKSISDQTRVKEGKMKFEDYMKEYGTRSDLDYELTSPRWHEIEDKLKQRISSSISSKKNIDSVKDLKKIVKTNIEIQILRSLSKKKALYYFDLLRKSLIEQAKTQNISDFSNYSYDFATNSLAEQEITKQMQLTPKSRQSSGKGRAVSKGEIAGKVLKITTNDIAVPEGTIGIFENASPQFAIQYPKCIGMIFLTGGQTSHGAIVAREFGIPALIDENASGLKDQTDIKINGATGEWSTLN